MIGNQNFKILMTVSNVEEDYQINNYLYFFLLLI
jgi:hypothetical protein